MTARLSLLAVLLAALNLGAAERPSVALRVGDSRIEMENRVIRLEIDKGSGAILKILLNGTNLVGSGKGYMQSSDENGYSSPKQTELIIARNDEAVLDIGFAHQDDFAVAYEFHYVIRPDEPGFYNYVVYGSDPDNPGEHRLAQLNYLLRLDPGLFTHFADGNTSGVLPTPSVLRAGKKVMDATYALPDETVYTKYNHSAVMDEDHLVYGLLGSRYGAWVIMPSHEHLNSVPFNTELTLHQTASTPVLLRHVQAAHHGSGGAAFSTSDEPWEKWGGPWFFYFNRGGSMEARQQEAQALAETLAAEWPFQWLRDKRFATERGSLRGQLTDRDGSPMPHARIGITKAAKGEKPFDFQQQWRGYRFFGWTDENGRFEIHNVWPDQYDLYAMKDDVPGRFSKYDFLVAANETTNLGLLNWQTPPAGRRLWQIGTIDRSGAEFGHGDDFRHWGLWMEIQKQFPEGIIAFDADHGEAREIPFILAAYMKADGTPYVPVLRIEFTLSEVPAEATASLLVALADAIRHGPYPFADLSLTLNGQLLADIQGKFSHGGAIHRSGIRGFCQEETITFPASRLRPGKNVLELRLDPQRKPRTSFTGAPYISVMFDALRLELQ